MYAAKIHRVTTTITPAAERKRARYTNPVLEVGTIVPAPITQLNSKSQPMPLYLERGPFQSTVCTQHATNLVPRLINF